MKPPESESRASAAARACAGAGASANSATRPTAPRARSHIGLPLVSGAPRRVVSLALCARRVVSAHAPTRARFCVVPAARRGRHDGASIGAGPPRRRRLVMRPRRVLCQSALDYAADAEEPNQGAARSATTRHLAPACDVPRRNLSSTRRPSRRAACATSTATQCGLFATPGPAPLLRLRSRLFAPSDAPALARVDPRPWPFMRLALAPFRGLHLPLRHVGLSPLSSSAAISLSPRPLMGIRQPCCLLWS